MAALIDERIKEAVYKASLIQGWMSKEELEWLARQAITRKTIVELGCWRGRSTRVLVELCPGIVYSIDDFRGTNSTDSPSAIDLSNGKDAYRIFTDSFRKNVRRGKLCHIYEDTIRGLVSVKDKLSGAKASMVFIDASHDYESVKQDIIGSLALLEEGGLICGHDYANIFPGLKQAVHELVPGFIYGDAGSIWHKIV